MRLLYPMPLEAVKPPEVPTVPDMPTGQLIRLYRIDRKKSVHVTD
jgi:hypothetical protein